MDPRLVRLLQQVPGLFSEETTVAKRDQSVEYFPWNPDFTGLSKEQHKPPNPVQVSSSILGQLCKY